ncbi:MAG: phage tail tape measure protein [Xanthobacteraceae bacterium]|nr:phage tail tape measure protein [Xanthobacteraceae bacterium]MBX3547744.1 phage tail tape measure protein [Xanthobacteraceae bacterium]
MPGNSVIGALRIVLGADTAELETGLKSASKKLDAFAANVANAGKIAAAGFAAAAVGLGLAMKGAINEADKLYKMSQSFGVPIEQLSALKYAADLSGVSLEALGKSLGKLSRNMMDAAANPTGEAARAFQALKISVTNADGTLKTSSGIMTEIADKFANMKDGAGKTALAIAIFGRAGADMIPMLNQGKTGLQGMIDEARALGLVFDTRTGAAAEAFNDNLTRMRKIFDGIVVKVTAEMLPAFLKFSQIMVDAAKDADTLKTAANGIIGILNGAITTVLTLSFAFDRLVAELKAVGEAISLFGQFKFSEGWAAYMKGQDETAAKFQKLNEFLQKFKDESIAAADALAKGNNGPKNDAPKYQAAKDALDKYLASLAKKNAATEAEIQTIGMSEGAHQRLKTILEGEAIAKENQIKMTATLRQRLEEAANAAGALADRVRFNREQWDNFRGVVLSVRGSLETAFTDAITQAKTFKDVIKSLIGEFARLAAQQAFRSMFGGTLAWEGLAGSLFRGTGSGAGVGALAGFASGGSFQVGGSGGIDSQLVAFRASPNERVSVTKPGQDFGSGTTYAPVYQIDARGADAAAVSRIEYALAKHDREFGSRVISTIRSANNSNVKL